MANRREFIASAIAAAASYGMIDVAWPARAVTSTTGTPRVLVDWHSHYVSRVEMKYLAARQAPPRVLTAPDGGTRLQNVTTVSAEAGAPSEFSPSDIDVRLANLDRYGIQRQLLTHTVAMGFDSTLPLEDLRPLYRAFNDELAEVVHAHPTRFLAVAALPSADPAWAAQELARAHRELGFIGGSLPLNAFATLEGARTLAPLFAAAQKHGSHFFVHRGPASSAVPGQPPLVVPTDTAYARWNLINNSHLAAGGVTLGLSEFLDPYPDVSVEVIMLAGFLPHLIDSLIPAALSAGVKDPVARLRRIYLDTGPYSVRNAQWVAEAAQKIGADRILFGSDYGVGGGSRGDVGPAVETLEGVLSAEQRRQIFVENSRALLAAKGHA